MIHPNEKLSVHELADDLLFLSDSQDVETIKDHIGKDADEFDSFFVRVADGDYDAVYGMHGIVPLTSKPVWRVR